MLNPQIYYFKYTSTLVKLKKFQKYTSRLKTLYLEDITKVEIYLLTM